MAQRDGFCVFDSAQSVATILDFQQDSRKIEQTSMCYDPNYRFKPLSCAILLVVTNTLHTTRDETANLEMNQLASSESLVDENAYRRFMSVFREMESW